MSRYTTQVVKRACEHREHGWSLGKISELLSDELGVKPSPTTILAWVDPEYRRRSLEKQRPGTRTRRLREQPPAPRKVGPERASARMAELHRRGLGLRAIGQVAAVWWGEELTADQVRDRLGIESGNVIAARRVA